MAKNSPPLHSTTHFRRIRELIAELCSYENINLSNYDTFNIRCHTMLGKDMKGRNVSYNVKSNCSCWVSNNEYDVFEIPMQKNVKQPYGDYLILAYNKDFKYYIFGKMTIRAAFYNNKLNEKVSFNIYGQYSVAYNNKDLSIYKNIKGYLCDMGGNDTSKKEFDPLGSRLRIYGTSKNKETSKILGTTYIEKNISGEKRVKIYKKKK